MSRSVRISRLSILAAIALGAPLLSACGEEGGATGDTQSEGSQIVQESAKQAEAAGYAEQAEILGDGVVTASEYEAAIDRTIACIRSAGYEVSEPVINPTDGLSLIIDLGDAPAGPDVLSCQEEQQSLVEGAYRSTQVHVMDARVMGVAQTCLQGMGFTVTGNETNASELVDSIGVGHAGPLTECVAEGVRQFFPEQTTVQLGF